MNKRGSYAKRSKEIAELENNLFSHDYLNYIKFMCKKGCNFYVDDKCIKNRDVLNCARKGLKNKD